MDISSIICALIGVAGAVFGFLQFLINRHDSKDHQLEELKETMHSELKDSIVVENERFERQHIEIKRLTQMVEQLAEAQSKSQKYDEAMGQAIVGLTHDKIVYLTDRIALRGESGAITLKEKATLTSLYIPYHDGLHGNGDAQAGYEHCMTLRVVSDAEARILDAKIRKQEMEDL